MTMLTDILTMKEAAQYLRISVITLRRWNNRIPFTVINSRGDRRYTREAIQNFIKEGEIK